MFCLVNRILNENIVVNIIDFVIDKRSILIMRVMKSVNILMIDQIIEPKKTERKKKTKVQTLYRHIMRCVV